MSASQVCLALPSLLRRDQHDYVPRCGRLALFLAVGGLHIKRRGPAALQSLATKPARSCHPQPLFSSPLLVDTKRDLAFNFDPPAEAQHVSSELPQAKLDEFRQMPWIEPDLKQTTLEGLQVVERYWRRYSPSGSAPLVWVCLWGYLFPDF